MAGLRILHAIDELRLDRGGVVRAVLDLTQELAHAGAEVTLLTGDATDAPADWLDGKPGCPRVVTVDRSLTPTLRAKQAGGQLIDLVSEVDLVHLHIPWDPFHPALARATRRAGKPYVLSVHGMLDDWCLAEKAFKKKLYLNLFGRKLLRRAAWLHFTTEVEANQSLQHAPGATPLVEPLVIDAAPFREPIGPTLAREAFPEAFANDDEAPRLLFLGRLQAIKGLPTLLQSLEQLKSQGVSLPQLLIAGPAEENHDAELIQQAKQAGLADHVHLLGMVNSEMKRSLYESADAFVLPSHHENFGIALVEAMMCGMPTLVSQHVGIWPQVEQLGGLVIEHGVKGFAGGMQKLLAELPERKQAALANRDAVFEWLDPPKVIARYLKAYQAAIDGKKPDQSL